MTHHDDIERRAYELYEARGRTDGLDFDDWLQAERELTSASLSEPATHAPLATATPQAGSDRAPSGIAPPHRSGTAAH